MSRSGLGPSPLHLVTVGDFDPATDRAIEFDFIGRVIAGRYTIAEHIGGGGMADVYRAIDEQLGVDVAVKLLKPRLASDELRARMVQEARAAARIRHPNLLRVFGTGTLDSTAFIVMEFLDGPNLEQHLREQPGGRLPCRVALDLLLPAFDALHAVHERGYVHRDIKTGNILIVPGENDAPLTAIVIDLGLVKPDRALRDAASPPTTEVGRLLCTPGYTSPEQAAGNPVDRRSDVYSMAVTLYRVLAGRLPFHEARGQPLALLAKHIYNEPTMLAEAAGSADIPVAVASVVERALSKDPANRPQTMQDFARALRAAAPPLTATNPTRPRRSLELLLAVGFGVALASLVTPAPTISTTIAPPAVAAPPGPAPAASPEPIDANPPPTEIPPGPVLASPDIAPGIVPPARVAEKRGPPNRHTAEHRALEVRTPEVQACADRSAGGLDRLHVAVDIDASGRISARIVGAPVTPLSRCIDAALRDTSLPARGAPLALTHTFTLRPPPPTP